MAPLRMFLVLFVTVQLLIYIFIFFFRFNQTPENIPESQSRRVKTFPNHRPVMKLSPSLEYEKTRRRLRLVVEEFWYFMSSQLKKLQEGMKEDCAQANGRIIGMLHEGIEYKRAALQSLKKLAQIDGFDEWRSREAADLSDLVQRRLRYLQNPQDCRKTRKLVCDLRKTCGFGCQLHHLVYCLITAYSSQRTMLVLSQGWKYNEMGWEAVFQPLSETCKHIDSINLNTTPRNDFNTSEVVYLPIVELWEGAFLHHLPRTIPRDLAGRISKLHEVPAVWWVGQIVKYLMRLQPSKEAMIMEASINMTFKRPIVGVHIRRSDKLYGEAAFHSVDEYMNHVEEYYEQFSLSQRVDRKRIYLASDDVRVFDEIRDKYPDYAIVGNPNVSKMAAEIRYCSACLDGLIVDLHLLANSDFLVCTFSSQICRVAYEIMQSLHPDASARFRSLDDLYYFGGGGQHRVKAVLNHRATSKEQMDLNVGDLVKIFGNLWNGFSDGFNFRTGRIGQFPSYKVEEVIEAIDFPSVYPQVSLRHSHRLIPQGIQYQDR